MIICFDCSQTTKKMLDELLDQGRYQDLSELVSIAISNQALLEGKVQSGAVLTIDESQVESLVTNEFSSKDPSGNGNASATKTEKRRRLPQPAARGSLREKPVERKCGLFSLTGLTVENRVTGTLPDDYWTRDMNVPLDRWIFGLHNKLLPVKASCRGLAHLLKKEPDGIPVDDAAELISEEATTLGDLLAECDSKHGIDRDMALATAFPTSGDTSGKGRSRYAKQFVAGVNKQGQVSGALIDFKLINYKPGKKPRLLLTESGWEFALLPNPVLDEGCRPQGVKFSGAEVKLLLNHIATNVRAEDFAYRMILGAIAEGANTPELLDQALRETVPQERAQQVTLSFLSSQRSGAISRMSDLGLVERSRDGVRVTYLPTELGRDFLIGKTHTE